MTRRHVVFVLFVVVALVQMGVVGAAIGRREAVLRHGRAYKFRTEPVDPFDAIRGRYVAIRLETGPAKYDGRGELAQGQHVYAIIETDPEGWARLPRVTLRPPASGDYLRAAVSDVAQGQVHLILPIDRYYMEEEAAPKAERAYFEHTRRQERDAYVTVRVWRGWAVLEELYVGGKPIRQFLAEMPRDEPQAR